MSFEPDHDRARVSLLPFVDHREHPERWAKELGISREAIELYLASDVIDLHVDSFIWHRIFGYDLCKRHGRGLFGARFYSQVDFPRALEARLAGAIWGITTNPARARDSRADTFFSNLRELLACFQRASSQFSIVRNLREYRAARAQGKHAAFIGVQGGNALDGHELTLNLLDDTVVRVTLVHLSSSSLGVTSSPLRLGEDRGLSPKGREYVQRLNEKRILVDLAHINPRGFWDAVEVSDRTQPLIVTHTGVSGVYAHWRNLDDRQLVAIAESGGTVGIMYHTPFLAPPGSRGRADAIVQHLEHAVRLLGDDFVSLGSDWDGAILPPRDMPTCLELPRLVELMLKRNFKPATIQKILGLNFLRVLGMLRG